MSGLDISWLYIIGFLLLIVLIKKTNPSQKDDDNKRN